MSGLLDFMNTDSGMQALGLLAAAAPSMAPMNTAGRIAMAGQSYQGMKENALKRQAMEQELQAKNIGLQRAQQQWELQLPFLKAIAAQASGSQTVNQDNTVPQLPQSVQSNLSGSISSDAVTPSVNAPQIPAQGQQSVQANGSMFGVPNRVAIPTIALNGFDEFGKLIGKYNEPTTTMKDNAYMGITAEEAARAARAELAAKGLMNLHSGATIYDPVTGLPKFTAPNEQNQSQIVWNNGVGTSVPIVNGANVLQAASKAKESGKAEVTPIRAFDAKGNPIFTNELMAATGGNTSGDGRYQANVSGGVFPSLSPSKEAAYTVSGKGSGTQYVADNNSANGFSSRMYTLNKALDSLNNAKTGPGTASVNFAKSFILAQSPDAIKNYIPGVDPEKIKNYDEANKYLTQYAMGKASALGEGTDAKLATTISGNASTSISNLAATDVVRANIGLEKLQNAQIRAFNKSGLPPDQYQNFATEWNAKVDPRVFVWDETTPSNRAKIVYNMSPEERDMFKLQYNAALQSGYIKGLKK